MNPCRQHLVTTLFAPLLCMYAPVVYSGIMAFTLYIYDAPNKLFKDNNKTFRFPEFI